MATVSPSDIPKLHWDYIFVGGGSSACVVSHRLHQFDSTLKILVIEAGPNANSRADIVWSNSTNLIGGDFDWKYKTVNQSHLDGRSIDLPNGKALGGGTVINGGGWLRGEKFDFNVWGHLVDDSRWSYDGQLPYMRKTERFWSRTINPGRHGHDGPATIQSARSMNRSFPLHDYTLQAWTELSIDMLPGLDGNAGKPLGVAELQENKTDGRRNIAAAIYPLGGITVLTDTLVEKVLIEKTTGKNGGLVAVGIQLADSTEIRGGEVIIAAGAIRMPLILSGIGPAAGLTNIGVPVLLDQPSVGQNLADHGMFFHTWKVFSAVIMRGEGVKPDPETHPLLANKRTLAEYVFMYAGAPDGSLVTFGAFTMLPTARGSVKLASANCSDPPLIDPNYLRTAVDRYVMREAVKMQIEYAGSDSTVIGREILNGETGAPGFDQVFTMDSTDEYIDARIRAGSGSSYHQMGTAAMGKVVDTDLKVKGVSNLRVVDASVFPVALTGHLQAAVFALAEQAAEIIYAGRS